MASVKHCISLREDLSKYAQEISHKLFQDNFAMFIGYLVSCHKEGIDFKNKILENTNISGFPEIIIDDETENIIDGIDNYFENE